MSRSPERLADFPAKVASPAHSLLRFIETLRSTLAAIEQCPHQPTAEYAKRIGLETESVIARTKVVLAELEQLGAAQ